MISLLALLSVGHRLNAASLEALSGPEISIQSKNTPSQWLEVEALNDDDVRVWYKKSKDAARDRSQALEQAPKDKSRFRINVTARHTATQLGSCSL